MQILCAHVATICKYYNLRQQMLEVAFCNEWRHCIYCSSELVRTRTKQWQHHLKRHSFFNGECFHEDLLVIILLEGHTTDEIVFTVIASFFEKNMLDLACVNMLLMDIMPLIMGRNQELAFSPLTSVCSTAYALSWQDIHLTSLRLQITAISLIKWQMLAK